MIRRRVLFFSGGWSRSHVWDAPRGLCRCGRFVWWEALGKPPRRWPVSKRCASKGKGRG